MNKEKLEQLYLDLISTFDRETKYKEAEDAERAKGNTVNEGYSRESAALRMYSRSIAKQLRDAIDN